ncbi:hypothetical protein A3Q56_08387 [Intoshia linei]|uniref:Uncharacterized protein n=1 Tax=Intoshia linei TaxID=1819745 RepID=A0A177APF2_9BILA|nr:hypothetical protein A3Q56_08387 [Intoshia linei]
MQVAAELAMPRQTIVTIARQKQQILQRSDDSKKSLKIRKTLKKETNDQMDKEIFIHFLKRRESKLSIFGCMLQNYGRQYLQKNYPTSKLKCSYGP